MKFGVCAGLICAGVLLAACSGDTSGDAAPGAENSAERADAGGGDGIILTPRGDLSESEEREIILTRAADILSDEEAGKLYLAACTADQTEFPMTLEECQCRLDHARANLSDVMFDLEVAITADESDIARPIMNTLRDLDIEYEQIIGETRGAGYDACLEGLLTFDE